VLWVRGSADVLPRRAVAIVGSRAATAYALEVAGRLAGELADRNVLVVSGLARGADGAAHRGCLAGDGTTVAVMGSGPDVIYPPEHEALAARICGAGALVSELGPGAPPLPDHFPQRNRLISGISLAVVVVEASERSGSLITARCALEQGARRHGGAWQRAGRPQPGLARAFEGRRKGRGDCGRYPPGPSGGRRLGRKFLLNLRIQKIY
jgi:DNA processing protein